MEANPIGGFWSNYQEVLDVSWTRNEGILVAMIAVKDCTFIGDPTQTKAQVFSKLQQLHDEIERFLAANLSPSASKA